MVLRGVGIISGPIFQLDWFYEVVGLITDSLFYPGHEAGLAGLGLVGGWPGWGCSAVDQLIITLSGHKIRL